MKRFAAAGVIMMALFSFFGCGSGKSDLPGWVKTGDMVFDYYERTVGTPEKQPYYEVVLYAHSDSELRMEIYTDGGTPDEKVTERTVPMQVYRDVMSIVKETGMDGWNERSDTVGIAGHIYVCKFPGGEKMVRVSSEAMPEDGRSAFSRVLSILEDAAKE